MKSINLNAINAPQQTKPDKVEQPRPQPSDLAKPAAVKQKPDQIQVSQGAHQVGRMLHRAKGLPDIRLERVDALRQQIQSGDYDVSSHDIAAGILRDEK